MTVTTNWEVLADPDPVFTVAEDLFATMIDGEPGHLMRWYGERPAILWEQTGSIVTLTAPLMAPDWSTGEAQGEALWPAPPRAGIDPSPTDPDEPPSFS